MKAFKAFIKPFETPQRSKKIKIEVQILLSKKKLSPSQLRASLPSESHFLNDHRRRLIVHLR